MDNIVTINTPDYTIDGDLNILSSNLHDGSCQDPSFDNSTIVSNNGNPLIIGDKDPNEQEIYIVEKWQTKSPIIIDDDLIISLKKDILSKDELHKKIMDKINDEYPEIALKIGADKLKIRKLSIPIEIKDNQ